MQVLERALRVGTTALQASADDLAAAQFAGDALDDLDVAHVRHNALSHRPFCHGPLTLPQL